MTNPKIKRALISVYDKTDILPLAEFLVSKGIEIISTGGTYKLLKENSVPVIEAAEVTGSPEILGGRVKTLHPAIHGGLLAKRDDDTHQQQIADLGITGIDLLIVNLYPFEETVLSGADYAATIEQIDIGGPAMVRSAAKNHKDVTVITAAADYNHLKQLLDANDNAVPLEERKIFAAKAFTLTAYYDSLISNWMQQQLDITVPTYLTRGSVIKQELRYGENPHQAAAFYQDNFAYGIANATQLQGKELSFNNINDANAAIELVAEFDEPCCAIIKHANPCGAALGTSINNAYERALDCDKTSAFGGIVALNQCLNPDLAEKLKEMFLEVIIAPDISDEAAEILSKKKNLRLLKLADLKRVHDDLKEIRPVAGGFLMQAKDNFSLQEQDLKVVTKRKPTEDEIKQLLFAFKVSKHVRSNAIVLCKDYATIGIGAGQTSRVDASRIAVMKGSEHEQGAARVKGSFLASDAFFPFADGVISAAEAGVKAIIQPGGSVRDEEVIEAADSHDIAMVFTGVRHFKH